MAYATVVSEQRAFVSDEQRAPVNDEQQAFVSDEQRAFYRANGYVLIEQCAPEPFLARVQSFLEEVVEEAIAGWQEEALISESYADLTFGRRYYMAWLSAGRPRGATTSNNGGAAFVRQIADCIRQDWLVGLAAALVGAERVTVLDNCHYRAKLPGDVSTSLPWHQDAQCLQRISGVDFVTAWIPLVDVSEQNSCLDVSPVGEQQGVLEPTWSERSGYVCMRESDADRLTEVHPIRMRRGDVLFLSPYTPHRSLDNTSTEVRWSVDFRYAPA